MPHSESWRKNWRPPEIPDRKINEYGWLVHHPEYLVMEEYVDIGAFTYLQAKFGIILEENVQIGSHCSLYTEDTISGNSGPITMKRNSCLGTHSTIMPGVTIGENTIVGAHSLVLEDVPPNVIAWGVPAKNRVTHILEELT
jgi:acetyltransferase-like isoleucine patch superfamily enzyme